MLKRICTIGLALIAAACSGTKGDSAAVTQEPPGANCTMGGVKVQVGSSAPTYVCNGDTGAAGLNPAVTTEAPGSNCAAGGVKIQVGTATPSYVCHGAAGTDGTSVSMTPVAAGANCPAGGVRVQAGAGAPAYVCTGTSGTDGQSVTATPEPAGQNCAMGGVVLQVGGGTPTYVCTGATGASGDGATVTAEPAGANCPAGGVKVQVGTGSPAYACNGANGTDGLSATVATEPAGPHCASGGVKVVGADIPAYACNGAPGAAGESAIVTAEPAGPNCTNGGVELRVGSGTPSYICNGGNGIDGQSATATVEPGGTNCPAGGVAVQVAGGSISYACNGTAGESAIVTPEAAGANCSTGGAKLQVGTGTPTYVCNGADAVNPCAYVPALSVTAFTMSSGMPYTATITTDYRGGIRPLTYSFMGEGGYYSQASATNQFTFVPNVSGGPYTNYVMVSDGCQMAWGSLSGIYTPPADAAALALNGPLTPDTIRLRWTNPSSDNFDHVEITWNGGGPLTVARSAAPNDSIDIGGLSSGASYTFTVRTVDTHGSGSAGTTLTAVTTCYSGYVFDGDACAEIDNCQTSNGGCDANAACTKTGPATNSCACHAGYSGDGTTCAEIDNCQTDNGGCDANAACTMTGPGTNSCACHAGYGGSGATCTAIDNCQTNNGGCDANAACTMTGPGTNSCACHAGYGGSGATCTAIDNCQTNNGGCDANAACTMTGPGTNSCACHAGYSGSGTTCAAIDSCQTNNGGCDANAACTTTGPGTNSCACHAGYSGSGTTCAAIDSCQTNNGGCDANATCTTTGPGTNSCACHAGYSGDGTTCTAAQRSLQLSFSGSGEVNVSPAGATCSSGACGYSLPEGTVVTLTATPASGWTFGIWSGCDSSNGLTCTVTMNQDRTVSTGFNNGTFTLAASYQGSGGSITSNPAGVDCGSVCAGSFTAGATIRLIAVPDSSQYFVSSWNGCTSFSGATCDVTMDSNKSVEAVFSPSPTGWVNACEQPGMTRYFAVGGSYQGGYDDDATAIDIGFSFSFYGQSYTTAFASTNALITFDASNADYTNTALPASGITRGIFAFWDDVYTTSGNGLCTATIGNAGSRQFVVTWSQLGFFGSTDNTSLTFSAILHEGTNAIDFIYYDMSSPQGTRGLGSDATIGLQGPSGANQFSFDQSVISNGQTIHFDAQ